MSTHVVSYNNTAGGGRRRTAEQCVLIPGVNTNAVTLLQSDPIKTNTFQWWLCRTYDRGGSSGETSTQAEEGRLTYSMFPPSASAAKGQREDDE